MDNENEVAQDAEQQDSYGYEQVSDSNLVLDGGISKNYLLDE